MVMPTVTEKRWTLHMMHGRMMGEQFSNMRNDVTTNDDVDAVSMTNGAAEGKTHEANDDKTEKMCDNETNNGPTNERKKPQKTTRTRQNCMVAGVTNQATSDLKKKKKQQQQERIIGGEWKD